MNDYKDLFMEECAICYEYAQDVMGYATRRGIDISESNGVEYAIFEYNKEDEFEKRYGVELDDRYICDIITSIGIIVEG